VRTLRVVFSTNGVIGVIRSKVMYVGQLVFVLYMQGVSGLRVGG